MIIVFLIVLVVAKQHLFTQFDGSTHLVEPELQVKLANPFFKFVAKSASHIITKEFKNIKLPDVDIISPVPVVGSVHLILNDISIQNFQLNNDQATLDLKDDGTLDLLINEVTAVISGRFRWTAGVFWSHGKFSISVVKSKLTSTIKVFAKETTGQFQIDILQDSFVFGELDVQISESKLTFLYKLLNNVFSDKIKTVAEQAVVQQVRDTLPLEMNNFFNSFSTSYVYKQLTVGLGLAQNPIISSNGFIAESVALIYSGNSTCPISRGIPKLNTWADKMVQLRIDERFMNCLMWGLHREEFFTRSFGYDTNHSILFGSPFLFNFSLPTNAPVVKLTGDGYVEVHLTNALFHIFVKSNNERSLEVKLKMNLLFRLELRIASNSSMPFIHRVIPKINHSVIDISVLPGEQNDFENEYLTFQTKLFEYSPVLASKVVSKFMNEHRSFVPVPISLPYPFDSIIFQDFDLEVREGEWWIGLELVE